MENSEFRICDGIPNSEFRIPNSQFAASSRELPYRLVVMPLTPVPAALSEPPSVGILLVNLGSPEAPTIRATRAYLRQFLADPRVVELPRFRWWLIRNFFILPLRPMRSARAYKRIWTNEGSPLINTGRHQAADLEWQLSKRIGKPAPVFAGMRYGKPSIEAALGVLERRGCEKILVLPLYPQYSGSTTGSSLEQVFRRLGGQRCIPELRTVSDYHDHPAYISSIVSSIHDRWEEDGKPERLLISFHGLPERYVAAGDPYEDQCRATAALITEQVDLADENIVIGFQSRFGREPWIGLETSSLLRDWGREGLESLDVVCPGFAADCLETLEEIDIAGRKVFCKAGGGRFRYIQALNRRPDHISALAEVAIEHLRGWT